MSVLRSVSNGPLSLRLLLEGCLGCRFGFHVLYLHRYFVSLSRPLYYILLESHIHIHFSLETDVACIIDLFFPRFAC